MQSSLDHYELSPRRLIIDLLRINDNHAIAIKYLIEAGKLFAFKESAIRVTVTRLTRDQVIECVERGIYRLTNKTHSVTEQVLSWRLGESRVKHWQGDWVFIRLPKSPSRSDRKRTERALSFFGFREGLDSLWARPKNLAIGINSMRERLTMMGLEDGTQLFVASDLSKDLEQCFDQMWPVDKLLKNQQLALDAIRESTQRLEKHSLEEGLAESFIVGSRAIHVLVVDPLLPSQMMPNETRAQLSEEMLAYDDLGRHYWNEFARINTPELKIIPIKRNIK